MATATLAFLVRLWIGLRGGGTGGTFGYDDGVYYAASTSLLWGRLPYRDFVLLHPPGIALMLLPFALLGRLTRDHVGFETARICWMLLGALNATLVVRICRRSGLVAAVAGGLCYAVWTPVALTETTLRLEPVVTFGLLLALVLLVHRDAATSPRLLMWAGGALALATSVKIWAVAPALLILIWLWRGAGAKAAWWTALGGLVVAIVMDGPFLLAAPGRMIRMVVPDQVGRGRSLVDTAARLARTLVPGAWPPGLWSPGWTLTLVAGLVVVLVAGACLGSARGRFALALLVVQVLVLVVSPSFFSYYNAFAGPGIALVVASVVAWLARAPRRPPSRRGRAVVRGVVALPLVLVVMLATLAGLDADSQSVMSNPFPAARLAQAASVSRCVTSDSPDALILTDLFTRDLRRACRVPVDLTGLTFDIDAMPLRPDGTSIPRSENPRWQRDLSAYLFSGGSIFVLRPGPDGIHGSAVRRVQLLPDLHHGRGFALISNVGRAQHDDRDTG